MAASSQASSRRILQPAGCAEFDPRKTENAVNAAAERQDYCRGVPNCEVKYEIKVLDNLPLNCDETVRDPCLRDCDGKFAARGLVDLDERCRCNCERKKYRCENENYYCEECRRTCLAKTNECIAREIKSRPSWDSYQCPVKQCHVNNKDEKVKCFNSCCRE